MADPRRKLTVEDAEGFPEDGQRHELIDGEHVVTASPMVHHQRVLRRLVVAFDAAIARGQLGEVFFAPLDVELSPHDLLQPDLLFVSHERSAIVQSKRLYGAPDLAVEVLSPSSVRTDELLKRRRYEVFGVTELWIVDPEAEVARLYRRGAGDRFERAVQLSAEAGDTLGTPLLPDLAIDLGRLFRP